MPAAKSSSDGSRGSGPRRPARSRSGVRQTGSTARGGRGAVRRGDGGGRGGDGSVVSDGLASLAEQLITRIIKPLGLVLLTRERIQETLDEAAERGRVTRSDANQLVSELVQRGRHQTDQLMSDIERLLGHGRDQLGSGTIRARLSEPMDRLGRSADRARRAVGVGQSFPILGYDDLTATQVQGRLDGLTPAELRKVRDFERRHANRKSVLAAIDRALA